jgi:2-keto-3-deoxy-L-rhamnonate aldolase RhmA
MRSGMKNLARMISAVGIAAMAVGGGTSLSSAQLWPINNVKQKMLAGQKIVAKRIDLADPAKYCAMASAPGTDFVWTDMVHSGMEYGYVASMWSAPCASAVARMRAAEIFYAKRVDFITKAYFRPPNPAANELQPKEMQRATDAGAMIIMINVDNVAQARQVVQRAYYPPMGLRDLGPGQYSTVYPASVTSDYVGSYNDNVVVIAIVSTVEGVSQANAIAAVPGIHALAIDTMNLQSEAGYPAGSADYSKLEQAIRGAARTSRKYLCTSDRAAVPNTLSCEKAS